MAAVGGGNTWQKYLSRGTGTALSSTWPPCWWCHAGGRRKAKALYLPLATLLVVPCQRKAMALSLATLLVVLCRRKAMVLHLPWPPCWWCHAGAMQWRSSRPPCWWCCAGVLVISTFIYLVAGRGRKAVVLGVSICIYLAAVGDGSTWHKYVHISVDSSCW